MMGLRLVRVRDFFLDFGFLLGELFFFAIVASRSRSYRRHARCSEPGASGVAPGQRARRISSSAQSLSTGIRAITGRASRKSTPAPAAQAQPAEEEPSQTADEEPAPPAEVVQEAG